MISAQDKILPLDPTTMASSKMAQIRITKSVRNTRKLLTISSMVAQS